MENGQRQSKLSIHAAVILNNPKFGVQNRIDGFFGAGLPDRAGDTDHFALKLFQPSFGELFQ